MIVKRNREEEFMPVETEPAKSNEVELEVGCPAGYVKVSGKSMRECRRAFVEIFRKLTRASKGAMRVEVRRGIGEVEM